MKRYFLLLILICIDLISCQKHSENIDAPKEPQSHQIELSQQLIKVGFNTNTYTVGINSSCTWVAESLNEWIRVQTECGTTNTKELTFVVECNENNNSREGAISIINSTYNIVTELQVVQNSFVPEINISNYNLDFIANGEEKIVDISSSIEYSIFTEAKWLYCSKSDNGLKIKAFTNAKAEERSANVIISNTDFDLSKIITVTQKAQNPNNVIYYASSDNNGVRPYKPSAFNAEIIFYDLNRETGQGALVFDNTVTSIGKDAFYNCQNLADITIPESVTEIGVDAFFGCFRLKRVNINNLSAWCSINFGNYEANPLHNSKSLYLNGVEIVDLEIPSDVTMIKDYTFCNCENFKSLSIHDRITSIGGVAFYQCSNLSSVHIPNSVKSIGKSAFYDCENITSLTIGDGVEEIKDWAFAYCEKITSVVIPNSVTDMGNETFYFCSNLMEATIGKNVKSIGAEAFYCCENLTNILIPNSVSSIGERAFCGCHSMIDVILGNSITYIGWRAFDGCKNLINITIPDSVYEIGDDAFNYCSNLTEVTIGKGVTRIDGTTFRYCDNLLSIYCKPIEPPAICYYSGAKVGPFPFNPKMKIYVPRNSYGDYTQYDWVADGYIDSSNWRMYESYIEPYDF